MAHGNKGRKQTTEHKRKRSLAMTGKKRIFTEEHCKNLSKGKIGGKHSAESKQKRSVALKYKYIKDVQDLGISGLHFRSYRLHFKNNCEICGMSNEEHKFKSPRNQRLSMHCRDADNYTDLSPSNWLTVCEFGCHQKMDLMDRK